MDTNKPLDNASDRLDEARDRTVNSVENTAENMSERAENFVDDVKRCCRKCLGKNQRCCQ